MHTKGSTSLIVCILILLLCGMMHTKGSTSLIVCIFDFVVVVVVVVGKGVCTRLASHGNDVLAPSFEP
jgi:hypothetical protein